MKLRQIALVAADLPTVSDTFFAWLGIDEAFVDEGVAQFGLQNIVMTIGETYLEVVSPVQEGTTAGRLLERRGGDGGYMVIVQAQDWRAELERIEQSDIQIVWQADTEKAQGLHMHPRDVPGAIASIDGMVPPEEWYWAGPGWQQRAARNVSAIIGVEIQSGDPDTVAQRWGRAYQRDIDVSTAVPTLRFEQGEVRFVQDEDGRGDGVSTIDLSTADVDEMLRSAETLGLPVDGEKVKICGTQFKLCQQ